MGRLFIDDEKDFEGMKQFEYTPVVCIWIWSRDELDEDSDENGVLIVRGSRGLGGKEATKDAYERVGLCNTRRSGYYHVGEILKELKVAKPREFTLV